MRRKKEGGFGVRGGSDSLKQVVVRESFGDTQDKRGDRENLMGCMSDIPGGCQKAKG